MRFCLLLLMCLLYLPSYASAQASAACENVDIHDAAAIKSCLESDPQYAARIKPMFEPNKKCEFLQLQIAQKSGFPGAKKFNPKTSTLADMNVPSCETISQVVELIHGTPSSWSPCLGYEQASDKFEHFKTCLPKYNQLRYQNADYDISGMDCKRAIASYQQALSLIYPAREDAGEYIGRKLPPSYVTPDCENVNAFINEKKNISIAKMEKNAEIEKAKRIRRGEEKAQRAEEEKELRARKQKVRESLARYDENFQDSLDEMSKAAMDRVKTAEPPTDTIDNSHIHTTLIKKIWDRFPEERYQSGSNIAKTIHTTHGFKTWTSNEMAPNFYHTIKNVDIQNCDTENGKAHCTYKVSVSSRIDYHGMRNQQQRAVYNKLGDFAGGGPRILTLESNFTHDGTQWNANLDHDQIKQIMPPEMQGDPNSAAAERERTHCDVMSTLSGWPVC